MVSVWWAYSGGRVAMGMDSRVGAHDVLKRT